MASIKIVVEYNFESTPTWPDPEGGVYAAALGSYGVGGWLNSVLSYDTDAVSSYIGTTFSQAYINQIQENGVDPYIQVILIPALPSDLTNIGALETALNNAVNVNSIGETDLAAFDTNGVRMLFRNWFVQPNNT